VVSNYKPIVVTIYRKKEPAKKPVTNDLVLEIPIEDIFIEDKKLQKIEHPTRGVQVVNIYGDEKI